VTQSFRARASLARACMATQLGWGHQYHLAAPCCAAAVAVPVPAAAAAAALVARPGATHDCPDAAAAVAAGSVTGVWRTLRTCR